MLTAIFFSLFATIVCKAELIDPFWNPHAASAHIAPFFSPPWLKAPVFAPAPILAPAPIVKTVAPIAPIIKTVAPATSYATVTKVHIAHPAPIIKTILAPQPIIKSYYPAPLAFAHGYH